MRAKLADLANRTAAFAAYVARLQAASSRSERVEAAAEADGAARVVSTEEEEAMNDIHQCETDA